MSYPTKPDHKKTREAVSKKVIKFHSTELQKVNYPDSLDLESIINSENVRIIPSDSQPELFFLLEDSMNLANLDFPTIRSMTCLAEGDRISPDTLKQELSKIGSHFLVFLESYNIQAHTYLNQFSLQETYHWQKKLLLILDRISFKSKSDLTSQLIVRNFNPEKDKALYIDFYNRVLGFLGSEIDLSFVEAIISRSSFDPEGYFIAEENKKTVGFLAIEKEPWGNPGSRFGYIYQIGVSESWRHKGLTEQLLKKAREFAEKKGIQKIGVGVRGSNQAAMSFFLKHGFIEAYDVKAYLLNINA
jgi:N-acetylglutamate synthase-like GNAT family acetyltransferase